MVQEPTISDQHFAYMAITRHWHVGSEPYTGADSLITALDQGWDVDGEVTVKDHHFAGNRSIRVYRVALKRGDESVTMHVIHNPYLTRMLRTEVLRVAN